MLDEFHTGARWWNQGRLQSLSGRTTTIVEMSTCFQSSILTV
jgi:hypothetical protein